MRRFLSIILCGVMVLFSGCTRQEDVVKESKKDGFKDVEIVDYTSAYLDSDLNSLWYLAELKNPNDAYEITSVKVILTLFDEDDNEIGLREDYICNIMPNESVRWVSREYSDKGEIDHFKFRVENAEYEECEKNAASYVENVFVENFEDVEHSDGGRSVCALLKNESDFDFDSVEIIFVFYNEEDEMVYADKTFKDVVEAQSECFIECKLDDKIPAFDHYEAYVHGVLDGNE